MNPSSLFSIFLSPPRFPNLGEEELSFLAVEDEGEEELESELGLKSKTGALADKVVVVVEVPSIKFFIEFELVNESRFTFFFDFFSSSIVVVVDVDDDDEGDFLDELLLVNDSIDLVDEEEGLLL